MTSDLLPPTRTELLLQQLGLDPQSFLDDVFNAADEYLADSVDALESVLLEQFAFRSQEDKQRTVRAVDAVYDHFTEGLDKYWFKFEDFAQRNFFRVPEGLEIPEGEARTHDDAASAQEEEAKLDLELDSLRQQLAQEQVELASLRREVRATEMEVQRHKRPAEALKAVAAEFPADGGLVEAAARLQALMDRAAVLRAAHSNRIHTHAHAGERFDDSAAAAGSDEDANS